MLLSLVRFHLKKLYQYSKISRFIGASMEQLESHVSQYVKAKETLEDQLLTLKEQREELKSKGARHDDTIMKDNARLQVRYYFHGSLEIE